MRFSRLYRLCNFLFFFPYRFVKLIQYNRSLLMKLRSGERLTVNELSVLKLYMDALVEDGLV